MAGRSTLTSEEVIRQVSDFASRRGRVVYVVGGYLRDRILRRTCKDIDVVMEEDALGFSRDFSRAFGYPPPVLYGRFGTAMVELPGIKLEFATCRKESYPEDSRKPAVSPATIAEDLRRRDFTVNAMARNLGTGKILDPFGGRADIRRKTIRTPIDPDATFRDDPLRILRGVRFACRFRFAVEKETLRAMRCNVERLAIVSQERIAEEILRTLESAVPSYGFHLLDEIGALALLLPEIAALKRQPAEHSCKDLFDHTLRTLDNVSRYTRKVPVRLAMLLHDIGKPGTFRMEEGKVSFHRHEFVGERMARRVCERLKVGGDETQFIGRLIRYHLRPHLLAKENPTDKGLRRFIREIGKDIRPLFLIAKSDLTSRNPQRVQDARARLEELEQRVHDINRKDRISCFKLAADGFTIMESLSIESGQRVGQVKDLLEGLVLDGVLKNRKRDLRRYLKEHREELLSGPVRPAGGGEGGGKEEET